AVALRRARVVHLTTVREAVDLPLLYVPYLFVRDHGLRVTRLVADALGAELGLLARGRILGRTPWSSCSRPRRSWCSAARAVSARRRSRPRRHSALRCASEAR